MKTLGIILATIASVLALVALAVSLDLFGIFYADKTADIRGKADAEVQIEGAASRIEAYERFYDLCTAIQGLELSMDALRANASMDPAKRDAALTAHEIQRARLVTEYNAESRKGYTAARFKASDLPWALSPAPYDGTKKTTCSGE